MLSANETNIGVPATNNGSITGGVNYGTSPINLVMSDNASVQGGVVLDVIQGGDATGTVHAGQLALNGNTITVSNAGPLLSTSDYAFLIGVGAYNGSGGFTGTITGQPNPNVVVYTNAANGDAIRHSTGRRG